MIKENGDIAVTDIDKANTLNNYFANVFTKENLNNLPKENPGIWSDGKTVTDILVTQEAIEKNLKKLDVHKAQGPDNVPPKVLKELSHELALPLSFLFNKTFEVGTIPTEWMHANAIAIFKKGTKSDPGNYRPVSLTSVTCKVFESVIRDVLVDHMLNNKLYTDCQHGFRTHRSCITQLLQVMEDFSSLLDKGECIDTIYLDFKKAFDSVPHQRLLIKLQYYGITGKVLAWIRNFLQDRKQYVRVGDACSGSANVLSGIPQGSILGPILLTIFINDLPHNIESFCKIFADDTKIYNTPKNHKTLQKDLDTLITWSDTWNLYFNTSKCKILHIGRDNPGNQYSMPHNGVDTVLNKCINEKDLGVTFDENLKFDCHIHNVVNTANKMLGIIKQNFSNMDKHTLLNLYKGLVRPHLEH